MFFFFFVLFSCRQASELRTPARLAALEHGRKQFYVLRHYITTNNVTLETGQNLAIDK